MKINYDEIFKNYEDLEVQEKIKNLEDIKDQVQIKLESLEQILIELNKKEDKITGKHIRSILRLFGYNICF
jgi:hypothetical protein